MTRKQFPGDGLLSVVISFEHIATPPEVAIPDMGVKAVQDTVTMTFPLLCSSSTYRWASAESLFYYFRIEDQVPENHLLRLIDRQVSLQLVREELRDAYSEANRPSIDPEVLLRILLLGYLYGMTSERKLLEELRMHLAWRRFTGLGFDQEIPHHSTFSKNRHGRLQPSRVLQEMFERIVEQCMAVGLVQGEQMSVDGSFIQANANHHSRIPRQQLAEAATASGRRVGSPIFRSKRMTAGRKVP